MPTRSAGATAALSEARSRVNENGRESSSRPRNAVTRAASGPSGEANVNSRAFWETGIRGSHKTLVAPRDRGDDETVRHERHAGQKFPTALAQGRISQVRVKYMNGHDLY